MAIRLYGGCGIPLAATALALFMSLSACGSREDAAPASSPPVPKSTPGTVPPSAAPAPPVDTTGSATAPAPPRSPAAVPDPARSAESRRETQLKMERRSERTAGRTESRTRGGAPSLPSQPPADALAAVDRAMASLADANIAFNAPRTMNLDNTVQIQLLLAVQDSVAALKDAITAEGEKESARVKASSRMEARLTGANFQITAISPEEQAITRSGTTEWKWEVKPTRVGSHQLHLTLTALFDVERSGLVRRGIKTFDQTIDVQVTWDQQLLSFVKENWQWLWAALLVPAAGWAWNRRKKH